MMKRWLLMVVCICLLSGCTKSNIIPDGSDDRPMSEDGIVWDQVWEDLEEIYADQDMYPFIDSVNVGVFPEDNSIRFFLIVKEEITPEEAQEYAMTVVKGFNDLISYQNSAYDPSSNRSYGGYVGHFNIHVVVTLEADKDNREAWILEDGIPAGEYRPIEIWEEEETEAEG